MQTILKTITRIGAVLLAAAALWAIGLFVFVGSLPKPAPSTGSAKGIVALTGDAGRIAAAMDLLTAGKGERLLISGVHPNAPEADLLTISGGDEALFECCVDLGRSATSTIGNAQETAEWARANGYKSLLIVTSDYHMPRTLILLRKEMPDIALSGHPIKSNKTTAPGWWMRPLSIKTLSVEMAKYLVVALRDAIPAS